MDKETFLSKIIEIGTIEDDVQRRTLLTEISDAVSEVYDNVDSLNVTIDSLNGNLTKANENLEKAQAENMKLFLRVGEQKTGETLQKEETGLTKDPEKRKFEDLFKEEKGE